jgi:4-amino-4-deoxy-L-arabinose transferase
VIAGQDAAAAACWYLRRADVYVLGSPGELKYGLSYPDSRKRHLRLLEASRLISRNRGNTVLIIRSDVAQRMLPKMPPPDYVASTGPKGFTLALF